MPAQKRFIFLDPLGKRWQRLRLLSIFAGLIALVASILFVRSLLVRPQLQLPHSVRQLKERLKDLERNDPRASLSVSPKRSNWLDFAKPAVAGQKPDKPIKGAEGSGDKVPKSSRSIALGFYDDGNPASFESLRSHVDELTHVCAGWMTVVDGLGSIVSRPDEKLKTFAKNSGIVLLPLLDNSRGDERLPEAVEALAHAAAPRQEQFIRSLIENLRTAGAGGVVLDWGEIDPDYRDELTELILKMARAVHEQKMQLWLCVPMGLELKAFDLDTLAYQVDHFIAMLHDQNSEIDTPGPLASQEWFQGWLDAMVEYGEPSQWIVALGSYGYDWATGGEKAEILSFHDVMSRAGRAEVKQCGSEEPDYNPHFFYEEDGVQHEVWFLDAATFLNQAHAAQEEEIGGLAISPIGLEDPAVWVALRALREKNTAPSLMTGLQVLKPDGVVTHVGKGEFLTVDNSQAEGLRRFETGPDGLLTDQYDKLPVYVTLSHQGEAGEDQVSISFDDGPDPRWTPAILDILKREGIKASFFLVGAKMETHPSLVKRIVLEGHEVGIHTYTHPNIAQISGERAFLEFNATQLLLQSITGRSTVFFRPPYNADSRPRTPQEVMPVALAQQLGYLTVAENIDPEDWDRPGVDVIVQKVKQQRRAGGNIILLHDAGGDRSQTVEALPRIIRYLKDRGDSIVTLCDLLGESPESMMPPVKQGNGQVSLMVSGGGFRILHGIEEVVWSLMIVATCLLIARAFVIIVLACRNKIKATKDDNIAFEPPVTVIMAAFNEEKVIGNTLQDLLGSIYSGTLEVLVIDDGSADGTSGVVTAISNRDPRVRLLRQTNRGKARALRRGVKSASHDILVMLDADTRFENNTIRELVRPLRDPSVAAVSGHAMVGNPRTFIARCQSLEYISAFNLDRRAFHEMGCITVVPGAVSALRRSCVLRVGGINTDTLAEDTDLTLSLHKAGYQVVYAPKAVAWTEAPETVATLIRQRFRWAFGTLQCLSKHSDLLFSMQHKTLGWFSIPSIWVFQVFLVAVAPFMDAFLIFSMLFGSGGPIFTYFLAFLTIDFFLAASACLLERANLGQVWLMLPMRFIYRGLLSWVIWKSLIKATKGAWVGWGKLDRTASVPSRS